MIQETPTSPKPLEHNISSGFWWYSREFRTNSGGTFVCTTFAALCVAANRTTTDTFMLIGTGIGARASGSHSIEWNGKTADGRDVPQGAYFVALVVEGRKQSETKIVRMK